MMNGFQRLNVLLVEDDDIAAEAVVRGLRINGLDYAVVVAEDGATALQILRGEHAERSLEQPFLVLLDLSMPRMSGLEFLRELRADARISDSVVFVLTSSGADEDRAAAYRQHIAGYMVKSGVGPQFSGLARFLAEYVRVVLLPPARAR